MRVNGISREKDTFRLGIAIAYSLASLVRRPPIAICVSYGVGRHDLACSVEYLLWIRPPVVFRDTACFYLEKLNIDPNQFALTRNDNQGPFR